MNDKVQTNKARTTRPSTQEFKDYETRRERLSMTGALEYRPNALHSFYLRGTWAQRTDDEFRNLLVLHFTETGNWDWDWAREQFDVGRGDLAPKKTKVGFGARKGSK